MLILQGCHERLMTWFMRYTSAISGLLFGSISLQVGCSTMHHLVPPWCVPERVVSVRYY